MENRLEDKIDKISDHLGSIDITLAKQSVLLEEHMRRSLANEEAVRTLKDELKPVLSHVYMMRLMGKIFATIMGSGVLGGIIKWLSMR